MLIFTFRPQIKQKHRYSVYLDGAYVCSVSEYTYRKLGGTPTIAMESKEAFLSACVIPEQYNYCLDILSQKAYTRQEMIRKLKQRSCGEAVISEILSRLTEEKLLSDADYREQFVKSRQTYKKQGFLKIRHDLAARGISLSEEEYNRETEQENLRLLVKNLLEKGLDTQKILRRLSAKGYRFGDILSWIKQLSSLDTEEWESEVTEYDQG